ncbi:MAG: metallophosphoesterase [Bryobacteraceae bacterium]
MRTIVHLSDLHFGRVDERICSPLIQAVHAIQPDLLAVSGDLTQRARAIEFESARTFLESMPKPQIVVPGNHDVPLHNLYSRFRSGLDHFYRSITEDRHPFFADSEIAVLGVNTARALVFKGGRINAAQISRIEEIFHPLQDRVKILVAHHPFDLPEHLEHHDLVGRARMALAGIARCGVDLVLSGHLHITTSTVSRSAICVQGGTALSTRGRGEANSFNVIRSEFHQIEVEQHSWDELKQSFIPCAVERFHRVDGVWRRA